MDKTPLSESGKTVFESPGDRQVFTEGRSRRGSVAVLKTEGARKAWSSNLPALRQVSIDHGCTDDMRESISLALIAGEWNGHLTISVS